MFEKFLISFEYSQGAQVVHLAAAQLSATVQSRVVAAVTFGDPNRDKALPGVLESRRRTFCAAGDLICAGQIIVLPPHLSYGAVSELLVMQKIMNAQPKLNQNAQEAASFVVARV